MISRIAGVGVLLLLPPWGAAPTGQPTPAFNPPLATALDPCKLLTKAQVAVGDGGWLR